MKDQTKKKQSLKSDTIRNESISFALAVSERVCYDDDMGNLLSSVVWETNKQKIPKPRKMILGNPLFYFTAFSQRSGGNRLQHFSHEQAASLPTRGQGPELGSFI